MTVYIGIDGSERTHAVVFLNEAGAEIAALRFPHQLEGFLQLERPCKQLGLALAECVVGIETSHNLLVDYLLEQDYAAVYVLAPNQGRFRQSGAKDDHADARLIAEILRTDRGRLHAWQPDSWLTRQMRVQVRWLLELQRQVVRLSNQLRAVLLRYYPAALAVFATGLTSQIASEFVLAYPDPERARALSQAEFIRFAKAHRYSHHHRLGACYARLQANYPPTSPELTRLYSSPAQQLAHLLRETLQTRVHNRSALQILYRQPPNHAIFASLPKTGEVIGPALLAFFGDHRERFPDAASVQRLAGTAPVTERSGKHRFVHYRYACDKNWRYICQEWARALIGRNPSPIALAYYHQIRPHCHSESHALRCVAHRWLAVAWKLWQSGQVYDLQYHLNQRAARAQPR